MTIREELQELLGQIAFPETPEERDAAENAVAAMLVEAWEVGVIHGHNTEGRLIDKREANPYLRPKPVPKTIDERFEFERAWDAKVEAGRK
jgi:hypothetical protein